MYYHIICCAGTWFIQALCEVLEDDEAAGEEDLGLLVSRVNDKITRKIGGRGERQVAEYQHWARKGLYLFPGIHLEDIGRSENI